VLMKSKFGYDDSLDVVGIHGLGGTYGAIATGLFASIGAEGLFYGNATQLWIQIESCIATWAYCFAVSWILFKLIDKFYGLRPSEEEEVAGMDVSDHSETGLR